MADVLQAAKDVVGSLSFCSCAAVAEMATAVLAVLAALETETAAAVIRSSGS